ncbi:hypothetical protein AB4072_05015 [Microvirga sp. 2MCAF38]|uniref:hypothetical protein n=1 Tax=Microvirga sp. 2MCAF38 TaxID=3232989 RepID=UPI003F9AD3F0
MANIIYDASNPLPVSGTVARLELATSGTTLIDLEVSSTTLTAIQAANTQRILIGTGGKVIGQIYGLQMLGITNTIYNHGIIQSNTSTAILFAAAGMNSVTNFGTIEATGIAIEGNSGNDRITNYGTLKTTSIAAAPVLMDLKGGNDLYDGTLGGATGGMIKLGAGDDIAYGGAGSETFAGGEGTDYIGGGGGSDTVDYAEATSSVTVDLRKTTDQVIGGSQGLDTLVDIENVIGSAHNDVLIGSTSDNTLRGGDGDDTLEGGLGADRLDGGIGTNTARYSSTSAAKIDLTISIAQDTGGYGFDTLIGIANLEGGSGNDTFIGDAGKNRLIGNGGNDTLKGGADNDTLEGGSGVDFLVGGAGNDSLDGGSGEDTAEYAGNSANYTWSLKADGSYTITDNTGQDGIDVLKDIRILKFADKNIALTNATPSAIFLSISSLSEAAAPGKIADIYGSDADGDTLTYTLTDSAGGLFAINGSGLILTRPLDYEVAKQHIISIKATDPYGLEFTKAITLSVRNVIETTPLVLSGTKGVDTLSGEAGNDRLSGLAGNDFLYGNDGADTLMGGAGNDVMFGGIGKDVFIFDTKPNVKTNVEYLYDFNVADDTIHLKLSAFKGIGKKGGLAKSAFWTGDRVHDSNDHIIYNKKTGTLFFDPDGTGEQPALQIASLPKNLKLTHKDFLIV